MSTEMSPAKSLEDRICDIEDRLEIYNLIASHPPSADTGGSHHIAASLVEDGEFHRGLALAGALGSNNGLGVILALFVVQVLNGLQLGVLLFLIAAGLTLVFGVMDFINLAHGVQYMLGAYLAVTFYGLTGSFIVATLLALLSTLVF